MSKHRKAPGFIGGIVEIICPEGHLLGKVVSDPNGPPTLLDGPGWIGDPRPVVIESDDVPADPSQPLPEPEVSSITDRPMRMRCTRCAEQGRRPDLRGDWSKLAAKAAALEADHTLRTVTYRIGG